MTKEEILDYIMNIPDNTNRAVLSDMLDELQTGGGSGGLVITAVESGVTMTLDKTWKEIAATFSAAQPCVVKWGTDDQYGETYYSVLGCSHYSGSSEYQVIVQNGSSSILMFTDDINGYPYASFD